MDLSAAKKQYDGKYKDYEQMITVVAGKISQKLSEEQIKIHSLRSRIKDFDSFYNKIQIKGYSRPFSQCEDLAGCRVTCLFRDQIDTVGSIIEELFIVKSTVQKEKRPDQFNYNARHFIVTCDEVPGVTCEIQVRTILQDAWAEIEHYVNYKHIGVDHEILRKVNALSALFEIADDQFQAIHKEFLDTKQENSLKKKERLNAVLLYHYCKTTFSWAWNHPNPQLDSLDEYEQVVQKCITRDITTLHQVHKLYTRNKKRIEADDASRVKEILNNPTQWPKIYRRVKATGHFYSPLLMISRAIGD